MHSQAYSGTHAVPSGFGPLKSNFAGAETVGQASGIEFVGACALLHNNLQAVVLPRVSSLAAKGSQDAMGTWYICSWSQQSTRVSAGCHYRRLLSFISDTAEAACRYLSSLVDLS